MTLACPTHGGLVTMQGSGEPESRFFQVAHRIASRLEPDVAEAFLQAVERVRDTVDMTDLEAALRARDLTQVETVLQLDTLTQRLGEREGIRAAFQRVFAATGEASAEVLQAHGMAVTFSARDPNAIIFARSQTATLVTRVTADQRLAIQGIMGRAFTEGIPPRESARLVHKVVGLRHDHAEAPLNLAREIREGRAGAATSRRLDAATKQRIRARIAADTVTEEFIEEVTDTYTHALRRYRAESIARTECLAPDTLIDGAVVRAVFRRRYCGDIVQIKTAGGRKVTATPNHPMLTNRGWLPAGDVTEADSLIGDEGKKHPRAPGDPDVEARPTTVAELYDAIAAVGICERRRGAEPDFHGDGGKGEIEVASADRELRIGVFASLTKPTLDPLFSGTDVIRAAFCGCQRLLPSDKSLGFCRCSDVDTTCFQNSPDGAIARTKIVSDRVNALAVLVALYDLAFRKVVTKVVRPLALKPKFCSVGLRPRFTGVPDNIFDPVRAGPHFFGSHGAAKPGFVELDRVKSVGFRSFRGHVYNLETPDGYFKANGVYTGNTIRSSSAGQHESFLQGQRRGHIPDTARRTAIVTPDERLRPEHAMIPGMNPDGVGIEEPFETPGGPSMYPPWDFDPYMCRCGVGLVPNPGEAGII